MPRVFTQTFGVVGAVLEKDGKILLIRENQLDLPDDKKWSHPAGWIDVGENPVDAIKREVREEAGYEFAPEYLIGIYSLVRRDQAEFWGSSPHAIKLIFGGRIGEQLDQAVDDTCGLKWFLPAEIYAMDSKTLRDEDIKQIVKDYLSGRHYPLDIIRHTVQN